MKNTIVLSLSFLLLLISINTFGQSGIIEGNISDKNTAEAVPFANLVVYPKDSSTPALGSVSEENGYFRLVGLEHGRYNLVISFIGYEADTIYDIIISRQSPRWHVGMIKLDLSTQLLDEVEIRELSSTLNTKIDRKVYTASDFETASGGNAVDILNKLPSVSVDPDGVVSVRGTNDFMVYLNGKPTQMDPSMMLSQIPADAILKIELISIPTAKYDAQGKGGIINITTKKTGADGFSLSLSGLTGGAPWNNLEDKISGFKQNDNRWGSGLNLMYSKKSFSAYGGVYANRRNVNGSRTGDARLLQSDGSYYHMVAGGERPEWYINYSANAGFDLKLNDKSDISASYFYGNRNEGRSAFYVYNTFYGDENKSEIIGIPVDEKWIYNPNTDDRYGVFNTVNLDFNHKIDDNTELKLSVLYENSNLSRELDNRNYAFDASNQSISDLQKHFTQNDDTPLDGFRFSADYSTYLSNGHNLSLGFQPSFFNIAGSFSFDTLGINSQVFNDYTELENAIDLKRGIYAGYIDYSGTIGKLDFITGLRLEYVDQQLNIENPDYFSIFERPSQPEYEVNQLDWFPSLHFKYNYSETSSINLAASRRISRPPIKNMAPFLYRRHFEVYLVGDPALEPEYLTNMEISFGKKIAKQNLSVVGFYRATDNAVFRVNTIYEEENVLIRSYTNSGNTQALGAELNANLEAGKMAKLFLGGSLYNYRIQGDIFGYQEDNSSTNWSLKGNLILLMSKSIKYHLDFTMRSATVTAQGRNEMFYMTNFALSYSPQKQKALDFNLKVLDIFGSNITGLNTRAYDNTGEQIFFQETEYLRYGLIVEMGLSYKLNMTNKSSRKADSEFGKTEF